MEARTRTKVEAEGWEFVSQLQGRVSSELIFRRPKPKTPWKLIGFGGGVAAVLIIVMIIGSVLEGGEKANEAGATLSPTLSAVSSTDAPARGSKTVPESAPPVVAVTVTDISVDDLLDRLNSAQMGGIKAGDQFRLTGEMFMSEYWGEAVNGDFFVSLKAQAGTQDLQVIVDETDAAGWQDGTQVEMVVEVVERTMNGELLDGYLKVLSSHTIA